MGKEEKEDADENLLSGCAKTGPHEEYYHMVSDHVVYEVSINRCGFNMHCLSASLTYSTAQEKQWLLNHAPLHSSKTMCFSVESILVFIFVNLASLTYLCGSNIHTANWQAVLLIL